MLLVPSFSVYSTASRQICCTIPAVFLGISHLTRFASLDEVPWMELIDSLWADFSEHVEEAWQAGDACQDKAPRARVSCALYLSMQQKPPQGTMVRFA